MFGLYANNINNCFRLDSEILSQNELDLYDVLNGVDLLMTDYSGVYFDFLLLNRPIIFLPVDLDEYVKTRGFLVDPYEEWTPGPKVVSQDHMELELLKSLDDSDYFNKDRIRLRNIIHSYKDSSSTKRVWKVIDELMNDDI